jgi:hypothetical protein
MMDDYYLGVTLVRMITAGFLGYALYNRKAGFFLKATSAYFIVVAVGRSIFLYRAWAGLQPPDPLMLTAVSLETLALAGMAALCWFKKFD